jgi:hypothetical protein
LKLGENSKVILTIWCIINGNIKIDKAFKKFIEKEGKN